MRRHTARWHAQAARLTSRFVVSVHGSAPEHGYKTHPQIVLLLDRLAAPANKHEALGLATHRQHQTPTVRKLIDRNRGETRRRTGRENALERGSIGPTGRTIARPHTNGAIAAG